MTRKSAVFLYTGHHEILRGGVDKYLFDLVNLISKDLFSISIYTDINPIFVECAADCLKVPTPIVYLNTRPLLFNKALIDRFMGSARRQFLFLNKKWRGREFYRYLRLFISTICLERFRHAFWNFILFYRLLKQKKTSIDIFHFNNGGYPAKEAGLAAIIAAHFVGIQKIVMSFHNIPTPRRWFNPLDFVYDFLVSRYCTKIIAASEVLKDELVEKRKFHRNKIDTIYCGLDDKLPLTEGEKKSYRKQLSIDDDARLLVICGNLDEDRKGHVFLFHALSKVREFFPTVLLLIVGKGDVERMHYLRGIVHNLNLEENVKFFGYRTDVHELNSIAEVAVVPSLGFEATPYTIKEASRAGKPVVTTTAGGCKEAVDDNITGIIVPPNDVEKLSEAILSILRSQEIQKTMGVAGRKLFLENFLISKMISEHERIYSLLG